MFNVLRRSTALRTPLLRRCFSSSSSSQSYLIKNGTIVNGEGMFVGDLLTDGEKIHSTGPVGSLDPPAGAVTIDATGKYIMPGGIDPHTHMQLPFMGEVACDDFETGTKAGLAGGTTTIIDFAIPNQGQSLLEAYDTWREWAKPSVGDYSFHVAVTWWSDQVSEEMGELVANRGVNSFKHFTAYKGALMLDDEGLVNSFHRAKELGAIPTGHCENGYLVVAGQNRMLEKGITGPEGHPQSRPVEVEAEATNRFATIAANMNSPAYVVHVSCKESMDCIAKGRREGQRLYGEALAGHLTIDDSHYYNEDWDHAAGHVMSPPFRPKGHSEELWKGLQSGILQTTATDHCAFTRKQKRMGKDNFCMIPNGTAGVEERMMVLWHHGVNTGRLTPMEYVNVTSANAAKIFNMYPRKGNLKPGADADILIWDPEREKTFSADTHNSNIDFSIFEGWTVKGVPETTLVRGKVVYDKGDFDVETGYGKYIDRAPFGPAFEGLMKWENWTEPTCVHREG